MYISPLKRIRKILWKSNEKRIRPIEMDLLENGHHTYRRSEASAAPVVEGEAPKNSNSAVTAASQVPNVSVPILAYPKDSPVLYSLQPGVYVAKLRDREPPVEVQQQWRALRDRLIVDLLPIIKGLPVSLSRDETVIEPELCMSGKSEREADLVELAPSIWIRCGSKKCREQIRAAVADLDYLSSYAVYVRLDAPKYAFAYLGNRKRKIQAAHLTLSGSTERQRTELSMHIPRRAKDDESDLSTCGYRATFRSHAGGDLKTTTCTIGGVLCINGNLYALTTAHSLFDTLDTSQELPKYHASERSLTISQDSSSKLDVSACMTLADKTRRHNRYLHHTASWRGDAPIGPPRVRSNRLFALLFTDWIFESGAKQRCEGAASCYRIVRRG